MTTPLEHGATVLRDTDGEIYQVKCPGCSKTIRALTPVGKPQAREVNGKTQLVTSVQLVPLPIYREVELVLDAGGRHITRACKKCAQSKDVVFWDEVYHQDMMGLEAEVSLYQRPKRLNKEEEPELRRHKVKVRGQVAPVLV